MPYLENIAAAAHNRFDKQLDKELSLLLLVASGCLLQDQIIYCSDILGSQFCLLCINSIIHPPYPTLLHPFLVISGPSTSYSVDRLILIHPKVSLYNLYDSLSLSLTFLFLIFNFLY